MKIWKQEDWTDAVIPAEANLDSRISDNSEEAKKAREKAIYYLQFSGKAENELRKKLAEQEFSLASIDYAIDFVKKYRYLDDEDYTRRFIEKNGNKKSRKQMEYELIQKGISRENLDLVFSEMSVNEEAQILKILEKKNYAGNESTYEEKQKISAYLARKGFSYDSINSALIHYVRKLSD